MHNRSVQVLIVAAVLALCMYVVWSGFTGPGRPRPLPEGVQTLTGTLIPAELSLSRRGTHVLKIGGEDVAYVESTTVNLRAYELTEAGVTGVFRHNTDPSDLPVLLASSVRTVEIPARTVEVSSIGLTLRVPLAWSIETFDDGAAFSLTGSSTPFLRVMRSSLTRLPDGTPMFIGGYDAVRVDGPNGAQTVHLQAGRAIVTFTWTSTDESQASGFAQLLRTAVVRSLQPSSQQTVTGGFLQMPSSAGAAGSSGPARAQPCGGPAGVLCPSGTYCAVNSPDGVGTCVPLR